jgi:hypothetical protein
MTDIRSLSDAELQRLFQQSAAASPVAAMSDDQLMAAHKAASPSAGDYAVDVAKSGGVGVAQGTIGLAGLPGDLQNIVKAIGDKIPGAQDFKNWISQFETPQSRKYAEKYGNRGDIGGAAFPSSRDIQGAVEGATGEFYKPQTTPGKFANTVGQFVPSAALMGGGAYGMAANSLVPGIASEAAGQAAQKYAPQYETAARIGGAIAAPLALAGARRAITPFPTSPERTAAVNTLRNEGVTDITAGQATGRKGLQYLEAERGSGNAMAERAGEQFTGAALRRVGENANRATPEVIDRAFQRIGGEFDSLAARNTAQLDAQLANDIGAAARQYTGNVAPPNRAPAFGNYIDEILNHARQNNGIMPGEVYQSLRSRMEKTARSLGANPDAQSAVRSLREALDGAMERTLPANSPDLAAWQNARNQYRNLLVLERATTGAGENAASGLISPAKLRQDTIAVQGRRNYARGQGDYADLARAGVQIMTPLPNSGTAGRSFAQNMGTGVSSVAGALVGSGAGSAAGAPGLGAGLGAAAGYALPAAVGHAATSRAGRAYLGNQFLPPPANQPPEAIASIVRALIARQQAENRQPAR